MRNITIIGGAGFIGINAAQYFLKKGEQVTIFDNFSRKGTKSNIEWLTSNYKKNIHVVEGDIRFDLKKLEQALKKADFVLHLAAQVAVTTSVLNPREDFEINALGTFNVLESIRKLKIDPVLLYSSTNKVYGELEDVKTKETKTRYTFATLKNGVSEERPLDFHSPYGCSKGAADQYVRDYARIYGLNTVVFRQSCIYGPRQFGVEDQGWVAWFIIALLTNKNITIYGDGKQVRDILYVDDLITGYEAAYKNIKKAKGQIYNIGGGNDKTISVWHEFKPILEKLFQRTIEVNFADWRPGDQPIFISDITKAKKELKWEPKVGVEEGITKLYQWIAANDYLFKK